MTDNAAPIKERPGGGGSDRPGQVQFKRFSETTGYVDSSATDPNFKALIQTRENLNPVIDFRFPIRHERFVSVRPYIPERTWEMAEIEIYGEGYMRRSVYRSQILDFGQPMAWSKIRWTGDRPFGTQIEIRTRHRKYPAARPIPAACVERKIPADRLRHVPAESHVGRSQTHYRPRQLELLVCHLRFRRWRTRRRLTRCYLDGRHPAALSPARAGIFSSKSSC